MTLDTFNSLTTVMSNIATTLGAGGTLFLACRWLDRRNKERAHDAGSTFFDDLHHMVPKVPDFTFSGSQIMATMAAIENEDSFSRHTAEITSDCLRLMNQANQLKLLFFARYAQVERREVTIKPKAHQSFETALIVFFDAASEALQHTVVRIIPVTKFTDYLEIVHKFKNAFIQVKRLSDELNVAFGEVIDIDYQDYFNFPKTIL